MAGLYALVIGVSAYPHLEGGNAPAAKTYRMGQLSAAALTAHRLADWLEAAGDRLAVPLQNCRLLLSPSPGELDRLETRQEYLPATLEQMAAQALEWRDECSRDKDNVAFFYFAGHGLQRSRRDAVLLMQDFADASGNPLDKAVDVQDLFQGMAPTVTRPDMARTQLWFVDACRGFPEEFDRFERLTARPTFGVELSDVDNRNAPLYYGALPGTNAYSVSRDRTIMGGALLECLEGAAGEPQPGSPHWCVTAGSLLRGLQQLVVEAGTQEVWDGGQMWRPDAPIVRVDETPDVRVRMELSPPEAVKKVSLMVRRTADGEVMRVPSPLDPNPFEDRWKAGVYSLGCDPPNDGIPKEDFWWVRPPVSAWSGRAR